MSFEDIETRTKEIEELLKSEDADIDALEKEIAELEERKAQMMEEIEERKKQIEDVLEVRDTIESFEKEEVNKKMSLNEVRNSKEYINAYADYIKTGDDKECRALLTENVPETGSVPVPEFVYDLVKTNWEKSELFGLVRKSYVKGNLKVGVEISGTPAVKHTEGGDPVEEEELVLQTVELVPFMVKKWISISDEVYATSEEFLRYIYDEITYRIIQKVEDEIISTIASATSPFVASVDSEGITTPADGILQAMALVNSNNLTILMNKSTWAKIKADQIMANYAYDPFFGMRVITTSSMGRDGDIIVGDFENGFLVNLPEGQDVKLKFDDLTLATSDLIRVIGRLYVAMGVVNTGMFALATLPNGGEK